MDDPIKFGAEIASLAIGRLQEIALSIEEASVKRERLRRVRMSIGRSIALGREAQLDKGMSPIDAEDWSKEAHAAFDEAMEAARREIAKRGIGDFPHRDA